MYRRAPVLSARAPGDSAATRAKEDVSPRRAVSTRPRGDEFELADRVTAIAGFLMAIAAILLAALASTVARAAPLDFVPDAILGKPAFTSGWNLAPSARNLVGPRGMAEDPVSGEFWVVDTAAHRVLRFASAHAFANGDAANLVLGQANFDSGAPNRGGVAGAGTLRDPVGIAVDQGRRVHVSDSSNNRVLVFRPPFTDGMDAAYVYGQPDFAKTAPNRRSAISASGLQSPGGIALDRAGRLWVADTRNARVLRYPAPHFGGEIAADTVIGQPGMDTGARATSATGLSLPVAVAVDGDGNVWVTDLLANRVTRYPPSASGTAGTAADLVLCQPDFVSDAFGITERNCRAPDGVAVDAGGAVHVAELGNSRVLTFTAPATGAAASYWTGQEEPTRGACNQGGLLLSEGALCGPQGVTVDSRGSLWVADTGNGRALRFDTPLPRPLPVATSLSPSAIARGPGDFDLTVNGAAFHGDSVVHWNGQPRPTRFVSRERIVARIAGGDTMTAGDATIMVATPGGPGTSASLVATLHDRRAGDALADLVIGQPDFDAKARFNTAVGTQVLGAVNPAAIGLASSAIAVDRATGRAFLADETGRVASWRSLAELQNAQGPDAIIGRPDAFAPGCTVVDASTLCDAASLAVDGAGRLYVVDSGNHRVLRFDPPFSTGMAATRVYGQAGSFTLRVANLGGVGAGSLNVPTAVAVSGSRLFVMDSGNNRLLVYVNPDADATADIVIGQPDMASSALRPTGASSFGPATESGGLAVDREGRLHVTDGGARRVLRFTPPFSSGMAADLVIGQPDFTSTAQGLSASGMALPAGVAVDDEGNLLVTDAVNSRVLRYAAPLASGMAATGVLGQPDFVSRSRAAGPSGLSVPSGIAIDGAGNVLVGDSGNARLLAYDRPFGPEASKRLVNIATRMQVLTGEDVLIGGFVIGGTQPKQVVIRARGPSLAAAGVPGTLADPVLQLFSGATPIAINDNWATAANADAIRRSNLAPADDREAAILVTLQPGAYTAIVGGALGVTGVAIVEVFEVDASVSPLVNIATRGRVLAGDDVMIGGFVIQGDSPQTVVIRARGPSLAAFGVAGALANPQLQLFAGSTQIGFNDDWIASAEAAAIRASGFAPLDSREAAILVTLAPGAYTAIVSGVGGTTGVAIVEVFVP